MTIPPDPHTPTSVVTGAARGLGAQFATTLARRGDAVVVVDVVDTEGEVLAEQLRTEGFEARYQHTDVTDPASLESMVEVCIEAYGGVTNLVNNAAIYQGLGAKTPFTDIDPDIWDRVFAVNVRGVWLAARAVFPSMRERGQGRIVAISSASVHASVASFPHYVASKAALIGLTRTLAREVGADGVTVNAIALGPGAQRFVRRPQRRRLLRARHQGALDPTVDDLDGSARDSHVPHQRRLRVHDRPDPRRRRGRRLQLIDPTTTARRDR